MGVSIVTPAYNAGRFLPYTIDSVLSQPVTDWEMVIVDDGSTDETASLVRSYASKDSRVRLISQKNSGASRARNRGLTEADHRHQYVIFLDSDDIWEANTLEILLRAMENNPQAVGAHGTGRFIDEYGDLIREGELEESQRHRRGLIFDKHGKARIKEWPLEAPTTFAVLAHLSNIVPPGLAIWRKSAVEIAGGFDPSLIYCEDWDLFLRISLLGDLAFIDQPLVRYRQHANSLTHDEMFMREQIERMRNRIIRMRGLNTDQRLLAVLSYCHWQRTYYQTRMQWAKDCWHRGQIIEATKQIRHAAQSGAKYTRWSLVAQSLTR
ncbi:MAG TPA: glycosyltransferase [Capsulimonadaceae bacterium]|nr:glycosyltransferase [Capsulimonadaceae bacterium]